MTQTISKSLGEGHGKGELYAALAHDTSDKFGGMEIKSICMNFATYDEETGDGRVCFANRDMYVAPWTATSLDIVAPADLWLFAADIYLVGTVHYAGGVHETGNTEFDVLLTDPTVAANALHGEIDAGEPWATNGNLVGVRGKVDITAAGNTGDATGVWAGITITSASVQRFGLQVGMNVEAYSNTVCLPNAVMYIQSLPSGSTTDFSDVPYLVFSETVSGSATGSNILFEVGHSWAETVPTLESGMLHYHDTLQIAVNLTAGNRTAYYIPLSTVEGSFTTAYPIVTTYATTAIDIGACVTGILITSASTYAIQIVTNGRFIMGTMDVGIPLVTGKLNAMEVHTEPASDLTADSTGISCGIRSRYQISTAQSSQISMIALEGRLRVKAALADGSHAGISGTIEAGKNTDAIAFTGTSTTQRSAGNFCVELSAQSTLANSGWLSGVTIDSSVHGDVDVSSACTFAGLRIKTSTDKEPWTYGIYMGDGDAVTGITIGNCASYGILMEGTYTNAIRITTNVATTAHTGIRVLNTYTAASGYHVAIMGAAILDSTAGTGSGAVIGVYGEANINDTFTGANNWSYGVRGCLQLTNSTDIDNVGSIFGAINAVLKDDATPTITNAHICGIYIDNLIDFDLSSATGISAMIYSANNASATCTMGYNWYIYGPKVTYLLGIYDGTVSGCVSETTSNEKHGGTVRHLKLDIDGTSYYLIASTTPTT